MEVMMNEKNETNVIDSNDSSDSTALTLADKLLNAVPEQIDVRSLINSLSDTTKATVIADLYKRITPNDIDAQDAEDRWQPVRIMVNNGKGTKAPRESRLGDFFNETTGEIIKKPMLMFPLHSHVEYTKWAQGDDMGKALAKSIDGKKFKNFETGEYYDVETLNPKPGRYVSPKESGYEYSINMFFTDKEFKNIYLLILKSYSIKECFDYLAKTTKLSTRFDPNATKKWFNLTTTEQKHQFGTSILFKSEISDVEMTEDEIKTILFFKQCARDYYGFLLKSRDADEARLQQQQENMDRLMNNSEVKTNKTSTKDVNASFNSLSSTTAL